MVLKASEICPATHRLIGTRLREAGLDHGVVNVLTHDAASASRIVETLIAHRAVRRINFTGSTRVGKILAVSAARHLKPILLELGGKAPLIILDDADLDAAVDAAAFGAFMNQGQICMSTERIIADEKVADAFAQKFVAKVKTLPCGDPRKGEVVLGAVVGSPTVDRVQALVKDAVSKGAKVLLERKRAQGTIMPAVIVDHVTPEMQMFREESFGPSVSITRFKTVDEAITLANDTEYGLSAAVFGPRHCPCRRGREAHRFRNVPRERAYGARRSANALRRRKGERLWTLRRKGRRRRVYRTPLDYDPDNAATLSVLNSF